MHLLLNTPNLSKHAIIFRDKIFSSPYRNDFLWKRMVQLLKSFKIETGPNWINDVLLLFHRGNLIPGCSTIFFYILNRKLSMMFIYCLCATANPYCLYGYIFHEFLVPIEQQTGAFSSWKKYWPNSVMQTLTTDCFLGFHNICMSLCFSPHER